MTGQTIEHLIANQWVERLEADDAEVLGFCQRAIESFGDAATPRLSRTGQFKLLYDAARQGVVALNGAHGYRARGSANHHEHTFAAGAVLARKRSGARSRQCRPSGVFAAIWSTARAAP